MPGFPDVPIVLVDHVGAKTGTARTSPLRYQEDNGVVAVAASKAGEPTHPAWFHNLMANPDTPSELERTCAACGRDSRRTASEPRVVASPREEMAGL
jgi:deazaflavin-dependent oxidoreductase (nitroreductase family)